jgi:uncharacterized membrane protein
MQMKNVRLDSREGVKLNAQNIYQQVVVTQQMPMNNATAIMPMLRPWADKLKVSLPPHLI